MTERTLLAEMRWRHVVETVPGEPFTRVATGERGVHPDVQVCRFCETDWPCDAAQLLAAIEDLIRRANIAGNVSVATLLAALGDPA